MNRSRAFRTSLCVVAVVSLVSRGRAAVAAEAERPRSPSPAHAADGVQHLPDPFGFTMTVVAGAVVDPRGYSGDLYRWQGGALVGVQGVFHAGLFEFGGTAEAALGGVPLFTETSPARLGAGVLAGTGLHFGKLHPEALVEVGTHAYWGVGPGPGIDGTVPYAGVRLTLALLERAEPSGHRTATLPQLWIFARQDLAQRDGAYQWRSGFDFSGSADAQTSTARIGGVFELGLAVGGGFDVQ